uniref:Arginine vasopressin-induced protein 1 n=1 Tax=Taeniopygia guttata TaxID=59729 RepID=A0A674H5G4_TAEGU
MGTPASVVSDSPGRAAPAARARKRASANIFQGVGLRELRSLFRSGGAERPEERARLVWRYAGQRRMARALRRLRRRPTAQISSCRKLLYSLIVATSRRGSRSWAASSPASRAPPPRATGLRRDWSRTCRHRMPRDSLGSWLSLMSSMSRQERNSVLQHLQQLQVASAFLCRYIWIPAMG